MTTLKMGERGHLENLSQASKHDLTDRRRCLNGRQIRPILFVAGSREMQIENFVRLAHVLATVGRVPVSFVRFKIVIKANGLSIPIQRSKRKEKYSATVVFTMTERITRGGGVDMTGDRLLYGSGIRAVHRNGDKNVGTGKRRVSWERCS